MFKIAAMFVSAGIPAWFIYDKLFKDGVKSYAPIIDVSIALTWCSRLTDMGEIGLKKKIL